MLEGYKLYCCAYGDNDFVIKTQILRGGNNRKILCRYVINSDICYKGVLPTGSRNTALV